MKGSVTPIGTVLAAWTTPFIASMLSAYLPRMDEVAFDARVWLFAAGAAVEHRELDSDDDRPG